MAVGGSMRVNRLMSMDVGKPGYHCDGGGLYLQVTARGAKSWIFRYSVNKKHREMGLGSARLVSMEEARLQAGELRAIVAKKIDPVSLRPKPLPHGAGDRFGWLTGSGGEIIGAFRYRERMVVAADIFRSTTLRVCAGCGLRAGPKAIKSRSVKATLPSHIPGSGFYCAPCWKAERQEKRQLSEYYETSKIISRLERTVQHERHHHHR